MVEGPPHKGREAQRDSGRKGPATHAGHKYVRTFLCSHIQLESSWTAPVSSVQPPDLVQVEYVIAGWQPHQKTGRNDERDSGELRGI